MIHFYDKLFVYGTLMSTFNNSKSIRLKIQNRKIGKAYIIGYMYEINGYPGAIFDPINGSKILGEIYHLHDIKKTFEWLDFYEEASLECNPKYYYQRILVPVFYQDKIINAWMYQYVKPTKGLRRIHSGDYLDYISN